MPLDSPGGILRLLGMVRVVYLRFRNKTLDDDHIASVLCLAELVVDRVESRVVVWVICRLERLPLTVITLALLKQEIAVLVCLFRMLFALLPSTTFAWLPQYSVHIGGHRRVELAVNDLHGTIDLDEFTAVQFINQFLVGDGAVRNPVFVRFLLADIAFGLGESGIVFGRLGLCRLVEFDSLVECQSVVDPCRATETVVLPLDNPVHDLLRSCLIGNPCDLELLRSLLRVDKVRVEVLHIHNSQVLIDSSCVVHPSVNEELPEALVVGEVAIVHCFAVKLAAELRLES